MELVPFGETSGQIHQHHEIKVQESDLKGGYDKHEGHHTNDFIKRFWASLILPVPILLLSHMVKQWLWFNIAFSRDNYVLNALGTVI